MLTNEKAVEVLNKHTRASLGLGAVTQLFFDTNRYLFDGVSALTYREHYLKHHYVKLPGFMKSIGFELLQKEIQRLRDLAIRRDFEMECMNDSPRNMRTLSGDSIQELSTIIPLLYANEELLRFLSFLTNQEVLPLSDLDRFVLNDLHKMGDTFGAHYDDYPISLALIFEAPPPEHGGEVELVANSNSLADLHGPNVTRVSLVPGDAYLLKSDTTAHRVAPLKAASAKRTGLNFAYTVKDYIPRATTPSAQLLYKKGWVGPTKN
ncbi:MAG: hypothetical protein HY308_11195 [Gammaproteobacteria bacterium]|nr:hypothetical protein [Gammaproteobacteria bacterium]